MKYFTLLALSATLQAAGPCKPHATTTSTSTSTSSSSSYVSWETVYTETPAAAVAAKAAVAQTSSPTSHVKGKLFDRYVSIWFENTDYDKTAANFQKFAAQGITLSNLFAVTHPSEPNYASVLSGDFFGMENDNFNRFDRNVSTVLDLLDTRGISWSFYLEDMPYSGYEGFEYKNQANGRNDYVRKHNPGILYDSVTESEQRLSQIKNLSMTDHGESMFHRDLKEGNLPQWMFVTPNMTSDAHDSDITTAGEWLDAFLSPLLNDPNFMHNTLVLISFDENETYEKQNNIMSILLGDAVPKSLHGTTDSHFYNHYSELASVEANWDLPTLGRWDVGANVFGIVAEKTGDVVRDFPDLNKYYFNVSYAGVQSSVAPAGYPAPNLALDKSTSGRRILESIKKTWARSKLPTYYTDTLEVNDGLNPPVGFEI